ncbi:hypothetical protein OAG68_01860 [bacterium]|nr:hypothetical protein [bacterium]
MNNLRHLATLCLFFIACSLSVQSINSQELPEDELATFVFEIDMVRLRECKLVQTVGLETLAQILELENAFPPGISMENIDRINGAFEFSETWSSVNEPNGDDLPMDFYVQLHFNTQDAVDAFEEQMRDSSETYEENGKSYYGPPENDFTPNNLRVGFENLTMEAGTTKYLHLPDRNVLSKNLAKLWAEVPQDNIARAAIDVDASRELVDGFLGLFKEEFGLGEPMFRTIAETALNVVDDINSGSAYFDMENQTVLSIKLNSANEDALEEIEGVANGLLFMGALPLKGLIESIPLASKDDHKPLLHFADQLKAEKKEGKVVVEVSKSENFDEIAERVYFPMLRDWASVYTLRTNLESIARAATNYSYSHEDDMPFLMPEGADWNADLSWRVRVLNHCYQPEFQDCARIANIMESWEHDDNQKLISKMPLALGPGEGCSDIVWVKTKVQKRDDVTDGAWETIMLIRLPEPTDKPWTHPDDSISVIKLLKLVSNLKEGEKIYAATYSSNVIVIDNTWTRNQLKAYLTPAAGDGDDE